jgi:hypothetical protein
LKALPIGVQVFHAFSERLGLQTFVPPGTKLRTMEQFSAFAASAEKQGAQTGGETTSGAQSGDPAAAGTGDPTLLSATVEIGSKQVTLKATAEALAELGDTIDLETFRGRNLHPSAQQVEGAEAITKLEGELADAKEHLSAAEGRATAAEAGTQAASNRATAAEEALTGAQTRIRTALSLTAEQDPVAEVERLAPDLADTRTYREHLITEALAMGVRAYGNAFQSETWDKDLRDPGKTLAELQTQFTAFEAEALKRLPSGRLSVPADLPESAAVPQVPDTVYSTRRGR